MQFLCKLKVRLKSSFYFEAQCNPTNSGSSCLLALNVRRTMCLFSWLSEAPTYIQQLLEIKKEEKWSSILDQEDQKPPEIKEEQEENDITELPFNPVKSEDEEKPQLPGLHHSQTKENGELVEPKTDQCLKSDAGDKTYDSSSESSETDISDGNWEESREAQSGLGSGTKNTESVCKKGLA
ncbi:PREDICTED: uncharacterized protein LOC106916139 isoform X8 [Poecilia mexicana]|uniref:uncharacterized protein LOC106916139 isoform X8 n=1 Tax=Poecilia mexicana TaxID=48701 RepID=UPI00072EAAA5|nr:PREDICTED: uncharacterized protein LOC106916139 isoform X8 [Poecilia mexicana]